MAVGVGVGRIACKYILKPTLIMGRKFDLRFYLLVNSFAPLRVARHDAFVIRLSNRKYSSGEKWGFVQHMRNEGVKYDFCYCY